MAALSRGLLGLAFGCALTASALTVVAAPPPGASGAPPSPPAHVTTRDLGQPHAPGFPPGHPTPGHLAPPGPAPTQGEPPHQAPHAEEHEEGPKPINWSDFGNKEQPPYAAALINFAILAFIYVYYGRAPIAAALKSRREGVEKQIEEAQRIKKEAEERSKVYTAKLGNLEGELAKTKTALADAGAGEKERIVREAEEKAARMEKDAQFLLEQEARQMQLDLRREAVDAALVAAEEILRSKITTADQERMAEEFLATLVPDAARPQARGVS